MAIVTLPNPSGVEDTAALNAAMTSAGPGNVFKILGGGNYWVGDTASLHIPANSTFTTDGTGPGFTVLTQHTTTPSFNIIDVAGTVSNAATPLTISGIHFVGQNAPGINLTNYSTYCAIIVRIGGGIPAANVTVANCTSTGIYGDFLDIWDNSANVSASFCTILDSGRHGIAPLNCTNVSIDRCTFGSTTIAGTRFSGSCIDIEPVLSNWAVNTVSVTNCTNCTAAPFVTNKGAGPSYNITVSSNTGALDGVSVGHNVDLQASVPASVRSGFIYTNNTNLVPMTGTSGSPIGFCMFRATDQITVSGNTGVCPSTGWPGGAYGAVFLSCTNVTDNEAASQYANSSGAFYKSGSVIWNQGLIDDPLSSRLAGRGYSAYGLLTNIHNFTTTTVSGLTTPTNTTPVNADIVFASWKSVPTGGGGGTAVGPARSAAGIHVDDNLYTAAPYDPNSTPVAWARGAAFSGFTAANPPKWGMIESSNSLTGSPVTADAPYGLGKILTLWDNLGTSVSGNFITGVGGYPKPSWNYSIWGNFTVNVGSSNALITCDQIATPGFSLNGVSVDQSMIDWCTVINKVNWPMVTFRYGWEIEFNSTFNTALAGNSPANYIAAYKHIHDVMNQYLTVPHMWEWNAFANPGAPNVAFDAAGHKTMDYYPGDAYVDIIGCDSYCIYFNASDTTFLATMQQAAIFAKARGKMVAFSEWGLLDDPSNATMESSGRSVNAMTQALAFFDSLPSTGPGALAYHLFFDGNPGGYLFAWKYFPKALAVYKARMLQP